MNKWLTIIELVVLILIMVVLAILVIPMLLADFVGLIHPRVLTEEELTHAVDL